VKLISIFVLLIYWSIILLAPVISKESKSLDMESGALVNK
jgi:hypothetical protein